MLSLLRRIYVYIHILHIYIYLYLFHVTVISHAITSAMFNLTEFNLTSEKVYFIINRKSINKFVCYVAFLYANDRG